MKKIFLLFALVFSVTLFAQKTLYVFNFSSYTVEIGEIQARHNTSPYYPRYKSNHTSLISIPSGQTYTLENPSTTRFPFLSVTSAPYIATWRRQFSAASSWSAPIASSSLDVDVIANPQVFHFIKIRVGSNGSLGGGNLGLSPYGDSISGQGWAADYSDEAGETVIFIYDN